MVKKNLKKIILVSLLAAMSIVLGKVLKISIGTSIRISFESLPIIISSVFLGPVYGLLSGLVADIIGCFIVGYEINPIITLGCSLMGFFPYIFMIKRKPAFIFVAVILSHIICSMLIKTLGLHIYYGGGMPLFWTRVGVYSLVAPVEAYIVFVLEKTIGKRLRDEL